MNVCTECNYQDGEGDDWELRTSFLSTEGCRITFTCPRCGAIIDKKVYFENDNVSVIREGQEDYAISWGERFPEDIEWFIGLGRLTKRQAMLARERLRYKQATLDEVT